MWREIPKRAQQHTSSWKPNLLRRFQGLCWALSWWTTWWLSWWTTWWLSSHEGHPGNLRGRLLGSGQCPRHWVGYKAPKIQNALKKCFSHCRSTRCERPGWPSQRGSVDPSGRNLSPQTERGLCCFYKTCGYSMNHVNSFVLLTFNGNTHSPIGQWQEQKQCKQ